jgi:hypothetical protein
MLESDRLWHTKPDGLCQWAVPGITMVRLVCWKGCGTLKADDDDDGDEKTLDSFSPLLNPDATTI